MEKIITELSSAETQEFFSDSQCYCNFLLPSYYDFQPLLDELFACDKIPDKIIVVPGHNGGQDQYYTLTHCLGSEEKNDVNFVLYTNKDGRYAWRPLELINPVAYTYLAKVITEESAWELILDRFKKFQEDKRIECCSLPRHNTEKDLRDTNIHNWRENYEKKAIKLSLEYEYMLASDISNCYGSIYTHSVSWAIHSEDR